MGVTKFSQLFCKRKKLWTLIFTVWNIGTVMRYRALKYPFKSISATLLKAEIQGHRSILCKKWVRLPKRYDKWFGHVLERINEESSVEINYEANLNGGR